MRTLIDKVDAATLDRILAEKRPAAPAPVAAEEEEEEESPELLARREALWSQIRRDSEARARGEPVR